MTFKAPSHPANTHAPQAAQAKRFRLWVGPALIFSAIAAPSLGLAQVQAQAVVTPSVPPGAPTIVLNPLEAGWLVSPAEALAFKGQEGFDEPAALRPRAVMPSIEVSKPDAIADTKVKAPFPIIVSFRAMADSEIDPSTFRVFYGAFKIDITERITKFVKVTPTGFSFDKANIPSGRHRLTLQVQDTKQRFAERELRVEVE